jgi:hypothetical protein
MNVMLAMQTQTAMRITPAKAKLGRSMESSTTHQIIESFSTPPQKISTTAANMVVMAMVTDWR